jgi:hypothetical protein
MVGAVAEREGDIAVHRVVRLPHLRPRKRADDVCREAIFVNLTPFSQKPGSFFASNTGLLGVAPGVDRRRLSSGFALGAGAILVLAALNPWFWGCHHSSCSPALR